MSETSFVRCGNGINVSVSGLTAQEKSRIHVERSRFLDCGVALAAPGGDSGYARFVCTNSLFAGCEIAFVGKPNPWTSLSTGRFEVTGCTVTGCDVACDGGSRQYPTSSTVRNSILWANGADMSGWNAPIVEHSSVGNLPQSAWGTGVFQADPQFVDAATGDYRLSSGSPAIDAGDPLTEQVGLSAFEEPRVVDGDLDGVAVVDLGFDEWSPVELQVAGSGAAGTVVAPTLSSPGGFVEAVGLSLAAADVPLGGYGQLLVDPALAQLVQQAPIPVPASPALQGLELSFQGFGLEPLTSAGCTSNRVRITLQ